MARLLLLFLLVALPFRAMGQEDPSLERRVTSLAHELRCLVCQNQTIADSNAPLAQDLRNQIREQLKAGKSEREVTDFMVARYGDFVLYRPPFKATTVALWTGPFVLLALGTWLLVRRVRKKTPPPELSEAERRRAAQLLE
ncbi:MAG TPA: cytochrome c-type biogenesis protein [Burkholderiales bacterium]|nr:cytochrome c-type biogenesis protein [Burkholderiales bacterium]